MKSNMFLLENDIIYNRLLNFALIIIYFPKRSVNLNIIITSEIMYHYEQHRN